MDYPKELMTYLMLYKRKSSYRYKTEGKGRVTSLRRGLEQAKMIHCMSRNR